MAFIVEYYKHFRRKGRDTCITSCIAALLLLVNTVLIVKVANKNTVIHLDTRNCSKLSEVHLKDGNVPVLLCSDNDNHRQFNEVPEVTPNLHVGNAVSVRNHSIPQIFTRNTSQQHVRDPERTSPVGQVHKLPDQSNPGDIYSIIASFEGMIRDKRYDKGLLKAKDVLKNILELSGENRRALLFKMKFYEARVSAIKGGPLNPLSDYRNPCWEMKLPKNVNDIYAGNPVFQEAERKSLFDSRFWVSTHQVMSDMETAIQKKMKSRIRCYPYFFILGVTKSGTTDLFRLLGHHPEVMEPLTKEPMYWNRIRIGTYKPGFTFTHYLDYFDPLAVELMGRKMNGTLDKFPQQVTGDGTPNYLWEHTGWGMVPVNSDNTSEPAFILPHTLYVINQNTKFIVLMRNPTDRVYSQYKMWLLDKTPDDFHEEVVKCLAIILECFKTSTFRHCIYAFNPGKTGRYMVASLYYLHLREWTQIYPLEQFFIIKAEEYFSSRSTVFSPLLDFLKLEKDETFLKYCDDSKPRNTRYNRAEKNRSRLLPMRNDTRELLDRFYAPFNKRLSEFLKDDKWLWKR